MEFFTEKNDRYVADSISGNQSARTAVRMIVFLGALGVMAYLLLFSPAGQSQDSRIPLMIGMGVLIFNLFITFVLKRAGLGNGVMVDMSTGTISFRQHGGNRHSVPISLLQGLIISEVPMKASILSLERTDGKRHILTYCQDTMKLRMYAGELASLTSLTVREEIMDQKVRNG